MTDPELIHALTRDLEPVRPIPALRRVAGGAVAAAALIGAAWVAFYGWGGAGAGAIHPVVGAALAVTGLGATLWGLAASVPGRDGVSRVGRIAFGMGAAGLLAAVWTAAPWASPLKPGWTREGLLCLGTAALLAVPSAALCAGFVARAAPHRPAWAHALVCTGAAGLGALGMHLACTVSDPSHVLAWHSITPFVAGLLLLGGGSALARLPGTRP